MVNLVLVPIYVKYEQIKSAIFSSKHSRLLIGLGLWHIVHFVSDLVGGW